MISYCTNVNLPFVLTVSVLPFLARNAVFGLADMSVVIEEAAIAVFDCSIVFVTKNIVKIVRKSLDVVWRSDDEGVDLKQTTAISKKIL